jgi:hypothetical protein
VWNASGKKSSSPANLPRRKRLPALAYSSNKVRQVVRRKGR